jgi:hypothetical protein
MDDFAAVDLGDGLDRQLRNKCNRLERRTMAILVAGDVGNNVESGALLVSGRLPVDFFDQLEMHAHAAAAQLQEKADVTRALMLALELPGVPGEELLRAEATARRILWLRWERVMRLAIRLLTEKEVNGGALTAALNWSGC